jgi:hypothetical protein
MSAVESSITSHSTQTTVIFPSIFLLFFTRQAAIFRFKSRKLFSFVVPFRGEIDGEKKEDTCCGGMESELFGKSM